MDGLRPLLELKTPWVEMSTLYRLDCCKKVYALQVLMGK